MLAHGVKLVLHIGILLHLGERWLLLVFVLIALVPLFDAGLDHVELALNLGGTLIIEGVHLFSGLLLLLQGAAHAELAGVGVLVVEEGHARAAALGSSF